MIEVRAKAAGNVGTFATEDIEQGTVIIRECPLVAGCRQTLINFHTSPNPTGSPQIDEEIRDLQRIVTTSAKRFQVEMLRSRREGDDDFNEKYPPRARAALDRLCTYAYLHEFKRQPESIQKKWLSLHDAFQDVPLDMESPVGIFGLQSEKGRQLNGTIGTSLGKSGTGKNTGRYSVRTVRKNEAGAHVTEDLWIKKENLKTVYGTCRSNAFYDGLFEKICRINHSCRPNTTMMPMTKLNQILESQLPSGVRLPPSLPNEYAILPDPDHGVIKTGDELTLSYLGQRVATRSTKTRRVTLREKYGFTCDCEACKRNECC